MPTAPTLDEQLLLAAIRDYPDDDTPRLMYADVLTELGNERVTCPSCDGTQQPPCKLCGGDGLSTGPPECRPCRRCRGFAHKVCPRCNGTGDIIDTSRADRAEVIRLQCDWERLKLIAHPNTDEGRAETIRILTLDADAQVILNRYPEWFPPCPVCNTQARISHGLIHPCPHCTGTGHVGAFRRGFVYSVRVPTIESVLESVGALCAECRGVGDFGSYGEVMLCSRCNGTGTTPGKLEPTPYAIRLFAKWGTVREVVPVDRMPTRYGDEYSWASERCLQHAVLANPACVLPIIVFDNLPVDMRGIQFWSHHATAEAAVAALGHALADTLRTKCHAAT